MDVYFTLKTYGAISNWQIIKLAEAIEAYKIGWFHLAMNCLDFALLNDEEIFQEPWNLERIKQEAKWLDIEKMMGEV